MAAVVFVASMTVVALLVRGAQTGVYFRLADQIAMVVLGLLFAAGALLFTRPRVRADADGVEVRNLLTTKRVPWDLIEAVSFPDGSAWARLELPSDEYLSLMAIQAVDRRRAVTALTALREMQSRHFRSAAPGVDR